MKETPSGVGMSHKTILLHISYFKIIIKMNKELYKKQASF